MVLCAPGLLRNPVAVVNRRGYWEYPEIAALCDPNPYYRGGGKDGNTAGGQQGAGSKDYLDDLVAQARRLGW